MHQPWAFLLELHIFACLDPRLGQFLKLKPQEILPFPTLCDLCGKSVQGGKPILLSYFGTDNEFFTKDQMEIIMDDINPMIKKAGRKLDAPVINTEPAERQDGVHLTELGMRFVLGVLINEHDYYFDSRCQYKSAQANPPSQH